MLYGAFALVREMQLAHPLDHLNLRSAPAYPLRMLDHWDNLDRTVERGYAGPSIWDWQSLPGKIDPRYIDYARANASIGLNATVLNNVNADPKILTPEYLEKVAALADVFRPYGIRSLFVRPVQQPDRGRRAKDGRPRSTRKCARGGAPRPTRSTASSPTSAAFW